MPPRAAKTYGSRQAKRTGAKGKEASMEADYGITQAERIKLKGLELEFSHVDIVAAAVAAGTSA